MMALPAAAARAGSQLMMNAEATLAGSQLTTNAEEPAAVSGPPQPTIQGCIYVPPFPRFLSSTSMRTAEAPGRSRPLRGLKRCLGAGAARGGGLGRQPVDDDGSGGSSGQPVDNDCRGARGRIGATKPRE